MGKSPFSIFQDPQCLKLFLGQLGPQMAEKMYTLGILWVLTKEFSPDYLPWFVALGGLPHLLLISQSGKWVNRIGPLKTVYLTDFFRAFLFFAAAFSLPYLTRDKMVAFLLLLNILNNMAGCFFNAAIFTLPLRLVQGDLLPRLNSLISACFSISSVLGPVAAVILYDKFGLNSLLWVSGSCFLVFGLLKTTIRERIPVESEASPSTRSASSLLEVLRKDPLIRKMLTNFLGVNLALGPLVVLLPLVSQEVFGGKMNSYATLEMSMGLGMIVGGLILSLWNIPGKIWKKTFLGLLGIGLAYFLFFLSKGLSLAAVCLFLLGGILEILNITLLHFFQVRPSSQEVPVVMSLVNLISVAAMPLAMLFVGLTNDFLGVKNLGLVCALIIILFSVRVPFIPRIREV